MHVQAFKDLFFKTILTFHIMQITTMIVKWVFIAGITRRLHILVCYSLLKIHVPGQRYNKYWMYRSRKGGHVIKSNKAERALFAILLRTNRILYRVYIKKWYLSSYINICWKLWQSHYLILPLLRGHDRQPLRLI